MSFDTASGAAVEPAAAESKGTHACTHAGGVSGETRQASSGETNGIAHAKKFFELVV